MEKLNMKVFAVLFLTTFLFTINGYTMKKTAYINAKIYSEAQLYSDANALLVADGQFVELGPTEQIKKMADHIIDLKNGIVVPGFIEAHAHLLGLGQSKVNLDLKGKQINEIKELLKQQSKQQPLGTWIKGRGWDQNIWPNKNFPNKDLLKGIDNPIYLRRVDGHAVWINDAALALSDIDDNTKDPPGGQIIRDENGKATGVLIDNAIELISKHLDQPNQEELKLYLELGAKEALSLGITSFHDAGANAQTIALYEDYAKANKLKIRIYAMLDGQDQKLVDQFLKRGPVFYNDFLTIRGIKYFADGALGSRGASLLEDYADMPHHSGLLLINHEDLVLKTKQAITAGFQVATHAIGDRANRLVLDAYEEALNATKSSNARLRIEHAQLIDPADHHRFNELSVVASMQPTHCTSDMGWVPERLGQHRIKERAYPWRSLLNKGAVLAFGSDAPVEEINPILGIYASVSRADINGLPNDGFMPEQKLKLKEAFHGYHAGAAYAEFNEHRKGKIEKGYLADFVVFDTDIFHPAKDSFLSARPTMTVVGGEVVFQR